MKSSSPIPPHSAATETGAVGGAPLGPDHVAELRALLGLDVVLLSWPLKSKGTKKPWGHLMVSHMTPDYLRKLGRGNIGVALGAKSGNLVGLDVDDHALVQPFLDLNPFLKDTLQTHGARGRVFWFRCAGEYPGSTTMLKGHSGNHCGEFRSNGSQSIIHGIHPSGKVYQIVHHTQPLTIEFSSILWPKEISNPPVLEKSQPAGETERQSNRAGRETEVTDAIFSSSLSPSAPSLCLTVEQAVEMALPDKVHQNNDCLFTLARAVKTMEIESGQFTPTQLRDVFSQWYDQATQFLRPEQSRDEYMVQFLNAYASARVPFGEGVVSQAWKAAREKPLPPEAVELFEDATSRLVVALCRELQRIAGQEPFYLSARTLQRLLHQDGHATAARWLKSLCVLAILAVAEPATAVRATRYRYLKPIP